MEEATDVVWGDIVSEDGKGVGERRVDGEGVEERRVDGEGVIDGEWIEECVLEDGIGEGWRIVLLNMVCIAAYILYEPMMAEWLQRE